MKARLERETMALRVAKEFQNGFVVNLGVGIPTLASNFVPEGRTVMFHTENGAIGFGPIAADPADHDPDLINASGQYITYLPGISFFDSAFSFAVVRGRHLDLAVLGALQVSEKGDLANWLNPQRGVGNVGGGMDIAVGARKLIIVMEHTTKEGKPKILRKCTYELTAKECVDMIVTDLAVIDVTKEGLVLKEIAPGYSVDEVQALTEARLIVAGDLKEIDL
ncbi:MAG: 3-oxoacid CoA-transferase subunit B [Dehalococcoidia bacterium]|nr:3-oxoacid CoA-transferase subunit B [Dehalococcoidia bacterium]